MVMTPRRAAVGSIVATGVLYGAFWAYQQFTSPAWSALWPESLAKAVLWIVPALLLASAFWKLSPAGALRELGLGSNPLVGYAFGMCAALPSLVTSAHFGPAAVAPSVLAGLALVSPIAEEVLFRGWMFRQLTRRADWPLGWAVAASALVFGLAHVASWVGFANGQWFYPPIVHLGWASSAPWLSEVGSKALGGLLFAWLVYRWDSVWPAIGLHSAFNWSWPPVGANGVTLSAAVDARLASVAVAIVLTWWFTREPSLASKRAGPGARAHQARVSVS